MNRQSSKLIADVIQEYIKEDRLEEGLLRVRIFEAWDLLMASLLPGKSYHEIRRLTTNRFYKDKVLTCRMSSSVIRSQLRFSAGNLPEKMNGILQGPYIEKVILQ